MNEYNGDPSQSGESVGEQPEAGANAAYDAPLSGAPKGRRSRQSRSQFVVFLNFLVSCVILLTLAVGFGIYIGKQVFDGKGPSTQDSTFLVKPNAGANTIAGELEARGLVGDAQLFRAGVQFYGNQSKLRAGEYAIPAGASMHQIMDILKSGKSILHSLTIPEGLTVAEAFKRIADDDVLVGDMPAKMPPEGSLAADTQRFTRGTTRQQVIDRMMAEQKKLVQSIWEKRAPDLPLKNLNEFVTLASIVEKETGVPAERPRVAAVFINRLKHHMRLQSDPTIIYGLFGGEGRPEGRPIFQSDKEKPTPYNTYVIDGLPPTPIANPGRAALEAVANPANTDDLYFVADGSGGHAFASTLAEHNQNVARWRKLEKERKESGASDGMDDTGTNPPD
ncbi:MAG: 4-amino-4-deoxychorismate lyase [Rhizobiales bacterium 65-79]|jgi:UPF0755 protein|nr:endolytic transglycosylase MltG [Hyphomicrobiales bacterium]OJU05214.1 MAG: 4-amino-4-deoxychorismate lyase [Rhizobiales bacterium 65-79]